MADTTGNTRNQHYSRFRHIPGCRRYS